jgi:hypothetical protein
LEEEMAYKEGLGVNKIVYKIVNEGRKGSIITDGVE